MNTHNMTKETPQSNYGNEVYTVHDANSACQYRNIIHLITLTFLGHMIANKHFRNFWPIDII